MNPDTSSLTRRNKGGQMPPSIRPAQFTRRTGDEALPIDTGHEDRVQNMGRQLLAQLPSAHFLQKNWWLEKVLDASMQNPHFKTQMFRFVDVFASLQTGDEMLRHLHEYLAVDGHLPSWLQLGHKLGALMPQMAARVLQKNMQAMAKVFIAGESPQKIQGYLEALHARKMGFTVDILDEATLSENEAEKNQHAYLNLIEQLASHRWPRAAQLDTCHLGPWPVPQVSIKLSALYSQIHAPAFEHSVQVLKQKVRPIFRLAQEHKVFVNVDMERYAHKKIVLQVFSDLVQEAEFCEHPYFGIVVQSYLREALADAKALLQVAQRRGTPIGIRLVKGAYWDYESIHAQQQHWPLPVWGHKFETDICFEQVLQFLLNHTQHIHLAVASHNVRSVAVAMAGVQQLGLPKNAIEFQMLYGMAQALKPALVGQGWRVREYVTMGQAIPGMAYLVRRLLENTSNEGFIKSISKKQLAGQQGAKALLASPFERVQRMSNTNQQNKGEGVRGVDTSTDKIHLNKGEVCMQNQTQHTKIQSPTTAVHFNGGRSSAPAVGFQNEAFLDWNVDAHRAQMQRALNDFKLGQFYRLQGLQVESYDKEPADLKGAKCIVRYNPSDTKQIISTIKSTTLKEAEQMVQQANQAQPLWQSVRVGQRSRMINDLADELLQQRFQLAACIVFESGKSWAEADGDVCEAIDFCRYYAQQMQQFAQGQQVSPVPGEDSRLYYEAYGVSVVIAPWNFPLAILTGMTAASLVTGHTVIMKPAEQSSRIAIELYRAWQKVLARYKTAQPAVSSAAQLAVQSDESSVVPAHTLQLACGEGEVGQFLSRHKDVHFINFTGSREVGVQILNHLATPTHIKQAVVEMGGKNALIIDDDADVDEAVAGALHSAFGFQGQKCSACSRLVVLKNVWDVFLKRFIEAARSLKQGPSREPQFQLGPVVDQEAFDRLRHKIDQYKNELPLVYQGPWVEGGYFVPPTIFAPVPVGHEIVREELFGPVVAVVKVESLDEAIEVANRGVYALTGGVYSRSPVHIERVRRRLNVGNLYINREITGALVGRHPFGGHKMSGLGDKTGGPHTLLQYMRGRVITENTVRRGFEGAGCNGP